MEPWNDDDPFVHDASQGVALSPPRRPKSSRRKSSLMRQTPAPSQRHERVVYERETTYGVQWKGRSPNDPQYDPRRDDPHHFDWCSWPVFWVFFIVLIVIALFAAAWWTAPPYHIHEASIASLPMGSGASDLSGSGGAMIPGLGFVHASSKAGGPVASGTNAVGECPPGSQWNATMVLCQPKLQFPTAVEPAIMDIQTHMCDSFYKHACGSWLQWQNQHNIEGRGGYADRSFAYLFRRNRWLLDRIVDNESAETPIGHFYQSCMNALVRGQYQSNARAFRDEMLQRTAGALQHMSDLPMVLARLIRHGLVSPITFGIENHPTKAQMVPFWGHDGFPNDQVPRDAVMNLFSTIYSNNVADRRTRDFLALHGLLEQHRPNDEADMGTSMREYAAYLSGMKYEQDLGTMQELRQIMRDIAGAQSVAEPTDWSLDRFLHALEFPKFADGANAFGQFHPVWIRNKAYYRWFFGPTGPILSGAAGSQDLRLRQWKAYVEFSVLYGTHDFAPVLEHNAYYHSRPLKRSFVSGASMVRGLRAPKRAIPIPRHRGKRSQKPEENPFTPLLCSRVTQEMMTGHVAKRFLTSTYAATQETHDRVLEVVQRIRNRFMQLIEDTWWFTPRDKVRTKEKLNATIIRVAQPHHWTEEPFGADVTKDHYWRNLDLARQYHVTRNWDKWDADADRAHTLDRDSLQRFGGALSTINAYFAPTTNTITVYAGILQHPFYHPRFNNASLYAIAGSIIGHELSHSLDPIGRLFDANGTFHKNGWWQPETTQQYMPHVACVIHEYGSHTQELEAMCPNEAEHLVDEQYGPQTVTEDMSDIVGTRLAYEAYFLDHPDGKRADLAVKQHFFYSYSQVWCSLSDESHLCDRVYHDVHPIPQVRVDSSLRHSTYFADAFRCRPDHAMGVEEHCNIFGQSLDDSDQPPPQSQ